ncbi:MAG: hypothetical protein V7733_08280 [Paraglaciecola polaris]|uniref:hypothetical protein n=1 Tax=Paraglaciecola polaris TaxID=222814 RepID=UPI003001E63F
MHFRLALEYELGIELFPVSHRQWDSEEALAIRMQYNGKLPSDSISSGVKVALSAGYLLVFSANMLHRGIYGLERMALDILLCDPEPALLKFAPSDCLPSQKILSTLDNSGLFERAFNLRK